jgi:3,4-dihydroxy 2-butanone 4-phosphate synthase/GTP cyclohydrolase II
LSPIEEIIEDARNGKMYLLIDAEDRENEGDLVIPAQFATPAAVNFMAKEGRGLICLAITQERAAQLHLEIMQRRHDTPHGTAFTVSIEAREGVSTGISAHDRSHTISVAIDPTKDHDDIVTPGHVFPLIAREGGVLVRAGHTEAAVDISRLAGLNPAGVICEVMNDDGTMARLPDLVAFAQRHGLKIGAISELIAYRRKNERFVERRAEGKLDSEYGEGFRVVVYRNTLDGVEHVALVHGRVEAEKPTLVRMHKFDFVNDVLAASGPRSQLVQRAMRIIANEDSAGVIVFVRENIGAVISDRFGDDLFDLNGESKQLREYGVGAQILRDLGVRRMIMLSNSDQKAIGLEGYGLIVEGRRDVPLGDES